MSKEPPKELEGTEDTGKLLLTWTAPIRATYARSARWYVGAGLFVTLSIAYAIWTAAWTFLVVLVLLTGIYIMEHRRTPVQKTIACYEHGVLVDREFTPWGRCTGFWMLQSKEYVELHIERTKKPEIVLQTGNMPYRQIRQLLTEYIPEHFDRHEHVLDMIARLLKI